MVATADNGALVQGFTYAGTPERGLALKVLYDFQSLETAATVVDTRLVIETCVWKQTTRAIALTPSSAAPGCPTTARWAARA